MTKKQLLGLAVASLFAMNVAAAAHAEMGTMEGKAKCKGMTKHHCKGSCKGMKAHCKGMKASCKGSCKGKESCKGKNGCKGN